MYDLLEKVSDPIGIVGVVLLLIAYFSLSTGRMSSDSVCYQVLNLFGAGLILFSLFFHWNTSAVLIEVSWIIISLIGIFRICSRKDKTKV
jgi:hypothetical protein